MIGKEQSPDIGKSTQWQPGQSGNPAGKKPGTKHISTYIAQMMEDDEFVQKLRDGSELQGAPIKAIIKTAIAQAVSGNKDAREWLAKYGYGYKVRHDIDMHPTPIDGWEEDSDVPEDDRVSQDQGA